MQEQKTIPEQTSGMVAGTRYHERTRNFEGNSSSISMHDLSQMAPAAQMERLKSSIYAIPGLLELAQQWGRIFSKSSFFGVRDEHQGTVFALEMIVTNQTPFAMFKRYHVIGGNKVTEQASAMLADFNERGGKHRVQRYDGDAVSIEFEWNGSVVPVTITYDQALQERWPYDKKGDVSPAWKSPLQRASMLFARVTTRGIRAVCPAIAAGTFAPEELSNEEFPNSTTEWPDEQTQLSDKRVSARDSEPCLQGQLDRIRYLGDQAQQFDPKILNRVKQLLTSIGKSNLSQLSIKEAQELQQALEQKVAAHFVTNGVEGKGVAGSDGTDPAEVRRN